ncbi:MAG: ExeM/NucH family extracellular endonuclease, partial [Candidatus Methylopumilus sp.]
PGQYFLVQQASGGANGSSLPAPDASGSVNMSGTAGKIALINSTTGLACNGGSSPCSSADLAKIIDLVGFGTANFFETSPAPAASASLALLRNSNGCQDQDNNGQDFSTAAPAPRNTASPIQACGGVANQPVIAICPSLDVTTGAAGSVVLSASDADGLVFDAAITSQPVNGISLGSVTAAAAVGRTATVNLAVSNSLAVGNYPVVVNFANSDGQQSSCTVNVSVSAASAMTPIYNIQGTGSASPLIGTSVTVEGIVTAVFPGLSGFYLQDENGDQNPLTSDGIFVFGTAGVSSSAVSVGNKIRLNGTVAEFNTVTELTSPSNISVLSTNHSVLPLEITLPENTEGDLERYEGMLVRITSPLTVSQNYFQGRYGQVSLSAEGRMIKPTNIYRPGSPEATNLADENARRRITLDDGSSAQNPNPIPFIGADNTLRAGDVAESITGVIDHGLITASASGPRDYKLHPTEPVVFARENARTATPVEQDSRITAGNIKVASFNVLNYFTTFTNGQTTSGQTGQGCSLGASTSAGNCRGASNQAEFTRQRDKIINAIAAINADVVGLMEIQNNGAVAIQNLVDGLNTKMGAGSYARIADPVTGTGTDAIKVAMIYKPVKLSPAGASLSDINSINNRPTLAQVFSAANGEKFSVIVNHLKSKSCSDAAGANADQNDGQGCYNGARSAQAQQLAQSFIPQVQSAAGDDDVLIIGDLNSYGKEDPIDYLAGQGFTDQITRFNGDQGYSYVFDGESGYLDHALANAAMAQQITVAMEWHINADEPFVIDYNTEFKPQDLYDNRPYKASDHDPVIVGLNLYKKLNGTSSRDTITGTAGDDVIYGGVGADILTGNGGSDVFVFNSMQDGIDTIADFQPRSDRIQLSQLLLSLGINSVDPINAGFVTCVTNGNQA